MQVARRDLLCQSAAAIAGVAFTSCGMRRAFGQEPRRREVIVNAKRIRTVDVHAHCHIPESTAVADYGNRRAPSTCQVGLVGCRRLAMGIGFIADPCNRFRPRLGIFESWKLYARRP